MLRSLRSLRSFRLHFVQAFFIYYFIHKHCIFRRRDFFLSAVNIHFHINFAYLCVEILPVRFGSANSSFRIPVSYSDLNYFERMRSLNSLLCFLKRRHKNSVTSIHIIVFLSEDIIIDDSVNILELSTGFNIQLAQHIITAQHIIILRAQPAAFLMTSLLIRMAQVKWVFSLPFRNRCHYYANIFCLYFCNGNHYYS